MNALHVTVVILAIAFVTCNADETNLTIAVDGVIYSNVTFGTVTPSSVSIRHSVGIAKVPLAKLPPELQKRFGYDPQKAADWQRVEQEKVADRQKAEQQRAIRENESKTTLPSPLKVGAIGVSENGSFRVVQVVGPDEMIAEVYATYKVGSRAVASGVYVDGRPYYVPQGGYMDFKYEQVWVKGIPTIGLADDTSIIRRDVFKVTGTKTFQTAAGSARTLFVLEPVPSVSPP